MSVILFISLIDFVLSSLAWVYYSHAFSFMRSAPFIALYVLLMLNTVGSRVLPESLPLPLLKLSAWLSGYWIAFLYYSLLLMVVHGIVYAVLRIFSFKLPFMQFAAAGAIVLAIFVAWGSWRAFSPVVRMETVVTDKLSSDKQYKIVLVSDIHLGRELGYDYSKGLVELVNAQQPDLVLIAGDIMDERLQYIIEEDSLAPLKELQAPLGVYGAYGNHDYLDRPDELRALLAGNNITILTDESTVVDDKLKITGLHDYRVSTSIVPLQALSVDIDKYYTQRMYKRDYGLARFGDLTAVVSNGYGFWGPPVRTELKPEIVVINLQGK